MGILDKITEPLKEYVSVFDFIKGLSQYNNQNLYDVVTYLNHYDFAENVTVYFIDIDYKIEPLEFDCYNNELRSKLDKLQTASYLEDFVWSNENFEKLKSSDKFKLIESLADFANIYNTVHWHFSIQELASIEPLEGLLGFLGNNRIPITLSEPQAGEAKQETVILQRDPLLTDLDIFNILEASCLISGDDPIQIEICIGDTYFRQNNIEYLKAEKLIRAGIKSGNLDHDITRQSLQNFLKIKGYIINGFNDNLPTLPTPQTDSQLSQKVADQQATIDRQADEIARLKAQLEQAGKVQPPSDTPAELKGIAKVNYDKEKARSFARIVAKFLWGMDTTQQIKSGDMANQIYALLMDFNTGATPDTTDTIKEWLAGIAPTYAKQAGRPPKNQPTEIPLTLKK